MGESGPVPCLVSAVIPTIKRNDVSGGSVLQEGEDEEKVDDHSISHMKPAEREKVENYSERI